MGLDYKLVSVQYREYEIGLLTLSKKALNLNVYNVIMYF